MSLTLMSSEVWCLRKSLFYISCLLIIQICVCCLRYIAILVCCLSKILIYVCCLSYKLQHWEGWRACFLPRRPNKNDVKFNVINLRQSLKRVYEKFAFTCRSTFSGCPCTKWLFERPTVHQFTRNRQNLTETENLPSVESSWLREIS
jgi:hypothetical protein